MGFGMLSKWKKQVEKKYTAFLKSISKYAVNTIVPTEHSKISNRAKLILSLDI